jgi:hypothetical protein
MTPKEALEILEGEWHTGDSVQALIVIRKALAVLRRAEPLLEAVEKCYVEDLEYCVGLYGESNPDVDPALDIIRAALSYRQAKERK